MVNSSKGQFKVAANLPQGAELSRSVMQATVSNVQPAMNQSNEPAMVFQGNTQNQPVDDLSSKFTSMKVNQSQVQQKQREQMFPNKPSMIVRDTIVTRKMTRGKEAVAADEKRKYAQKSAKVNQPPATGNQLPSQDASQQQPRQRSRDFSMETQSKQSR